MYFVNSQTYIKKHFNLILINIFNYTCVNYLYRDTKCNTIKKNVPDICIV